MPDFNLEKYIIDKNKNIIETEFVKRLEYWKLSKEEFINFWLQRYLIPKKFEELLYVWIEKAKNELKDTELESNLYMNYLDENWLDINWNKLKIGSHKEWRNDFNNALFIKYSKIDLENIKICDWTQSFIDSYDNLISKWDWLMIIWALLFLEYNIPEEYKRVKISRDILFKNEFVINNNDTIENITKKRIWCMYIDNHIIHDSKIHYPTLKEKLIKYLNNEKNIDLIKKWIDIISEWKLKFYEWFDNL